MRETINAKEKALQESTEQASKLNRALQEMKQLLIKTATNAEQEQTSNQAKLNGLSDLN